MDKNNIGGVNKETVQTDKARIKIRSFYRAVQAGCLPDVYTHAIISFRHSFLAVNHHNIKN